MPRVDHMEFSGEVIDSNRDFFKVQTEFSVVDCKISGSLRKNSIKVYVGDKVKIEVSPYETTKGIITYRVK